MARTKKEIEEQAPDAEPETTGTESDPVPQTEQETPPGEVANAGVTDLELAAAKSLDPDAPQTDLESGDDPDGQAAPPQTDPEWDPDSQSESGQGTFSSQTDMESADSNAGSQTDLEPAEEPGGGQAFDPTADLGSQTEPETEPDDEAMPQSEGDAAAEGDAEPPAPPRRRRTSRKKAAEVQEAQDGGEDVPAEEEQSESGQPQKLRMPGRRRQRVVSIDAERTVETDTDRLRNDLLDLVESLKSKKILTGTIQGVERLADNPEMSYAVIYHGDFKVIIPVLEAIEERRTTAASPRATCSTICSTSGWARRWITSSRASTRNTTWWLPAGWRPWRSSAGSTTSVPTGTATTRSMRASAPRHGSSPSSGRASLWTCSARSAISPSGAVLPALGGRRAALSARPARAGAGAGGGPQRPQPSQGDCLGEAAMENPYEKALKKYVVGNRYVGTVSMVDLNGVFVSLDGGIDCLCTYPKRGRPPRGARATVRILGINHENNRIWGVITHMSTTR